MYVNSELDQGSTQTLALRGQEIRSYDRMCRSRTDEVCGSHRGCKISLIRMPAEADSRT